jgi:hypothetical protein
MTACCKAAREVMNQGTFGFTADTLSMSELVDLFE